MSCKSYQYGKPYDVLNNEKPNGLQQYSLGRLTLDRVKTITIKDPEDPRVKMLNILEKISIE